MAQERLDGVLVVDKPGGMTSHDVVAAVRRAVRRTTGGGRKSAKVGHAGTLDPSATGVLVVCVGKATRLVPYLQASSKTYDATAVLGVTTSTLDADGEILSERDATAVDEPAVCETLKRFVGEVDQIPPMVSAVKVGGERLYAKARRGESVDRAPRTVTIHDIVLEQFHPGPRPRVDFLVTCSTGTYVRTLAADVGEALGVGGHLATLRRIGSGRFLVGDAVGVDAIEEATQAGRFAELLLPPRAAVGDYPARWLDEEETDDVAHGRPLPASEREGPVAAIGTDGRLVAMIEDRDGRAWPLVVLVP